MPISPLKFANNPDGYLDDYEAEAAAARAAYLDTEADREYEIIASATSS